jgi:hypothetical protein
MLLPNGAAYLMPEEGEGRYTVPSLLGRQLGSTMLGSAFRLYHGSHNRWDPYQHDGLAVMLDVQLPANTIAAAFWVAMNRCWQAAAVAATYPTQLLLAWATALVFWRQDGRLCCLRLVSAQRAVLKAAGLVCAAGRELQVALGPKDPLLVQLEASADAEGRVRPAAKLLQSRQPQRSCPQVSGVGAPGAREKRATDVNMAATSCPAILQAMHAGALLSGTEQCSMTLRHHVGEARWPEVRLALLELYVQLPMLLEAASETWAKHRAATLHRRAQRQQLPPPIGGECLAAASDVESEAGGSGSSDEQEEEVDEGDEELGEEDVEDEEVDALPDGAGGHEDGNDDHGVEEPVKYEDLQWPVRLAMELPPGRARLAAAKLAEKKPLKEALLAWLQLPLVLQTHTEVQACLQDMRRVVEQMALAGSVAWRLGAT